MDGLKEIALVIGIVGLTYLGFEFTHQGGPFLGAAILFGLLVLRQFR